MKAIVISIVCFSIVQLPLVIQGKHNQTKELLDGIAENGGNIDDIFQPSKNGCLGYGQAGLTYKGILLTINESVAMKFIPVGHEGEYQAENEYQAYICLGAVNKTKIEAYGIPALYYHGRWENYTIMATSLLDSEFAHRKENLQLTVVDTLIVFREMVRISKYIHSCGICHRDPHLTNILFRGHRGFLIDYDMAINVKNDKDARIACAKKDWRRFLASIVKMFNRRIDMASEINPIEIFQGIKPEGLKRVFCEFTTTAYEDAELKYNKLYEIIHEEIERYRGDEPAIVSWLTAEQRLEAISDLSMNGIPPIEI